MSVVPIICVESVEETSKLLLPLLGWKSNHGGTEFDDLVDQKGRSVLWLHSLASADEARFKNSDSKTRGVGFSIYVLVTNLDNTYSKCQLADVEMVEELFYNKNTQFREFTIKIPDGYQFTVCEKGPYLKF